MIKAIIFDLGGVLIDWNPRYLYTKIFDNEAEIENFLETVCTADWNEEQDAGRSLKKATNILIEKFPEHSENIHAYYGRWEEMLGGPVEGTVELFRKLKEQGKYKIYALTNWSAELFPVAQKRFDFLNWFDGIVVSGTERSRKPFPDFYQLLLDRYDVKADEALFIDDNLRNAEAARKIGIETIHFISPGQLLRELKDKEILQ